MKILISTILILLLTSCTAINSGLSYLDGKSDQAIESLMQASDINLDKAIKTICGVARGGSLQKRFNTEELKKARATICESIKAEL